ncbi:anthrax toxin receptor-like [Ochotona princeps]|uniref:anthrax toxin receptor-like n=1 Tax=Ochotona princeps TaxID=9978 RepID=UPI00271480B8|nr:anthrax toxin receptor-like [Ochotona princeps]
MAGKDVNGCVSFLKPKRDRPPPPPPPPVTVCPTVIICCCTCRGMCMRRGLQGNLNPLCNIIPPSCQQLPLMWCRSREQERWPSLTLMKNPCNPSACLQPNLDRLPLTWCPQCHHLPDRCSRPSSRLLPLPPARDQGLYRNTLSLPPP